MGNWPQVCNSGVMPYIPPTMGQPCPNQLQGSPLEATGRASAAGNLLQLPRPRLRQGKPRGRSSQQKLPTRNAS